MGVRVRVKGVFLRRRIAGVAGVRSAGIPPKGTLVAKTFKPAFQPKNFPEHVSCPYTVKIAPVANFASPSQVTYYDERGYLETTSPKKYALEGGMGIGVDLGPGCANYRVRVFLVYPNTFGLPTPPSFIDSGTLIGTLSGSVHEPPALIPTDVAGSATLRFEVDKFACDGESCYPVTPVSKSSFPAEIRPQGGWGGVAYERPTSFNPGTIERGPDLLG